MNREELDKEEKRKIDDILEGNLPEIKEAWKKQDFTLVSKKLYPEFDFQEPYCLLAPSKVPLHAFFPFYKTVILPVDPLKKEVFERAYGITINNLIKLCREGAVLPMISDPFSDYPSDYDELFKEFWDGKVVRLGRFHTVFNSLRKEESGISLQDETKKDISRKFGDSPDFEEIIPEVKKTYQTDPKKLLSQTLHYYLLGFKMLGFDEIYKKVINEKDAVHAYKSAGACYSAIDGGRLTTGLLGYANYDEASLEKINHKNLKNFYNKKSITLPKLLYYELPVVLGYEHPKNVKDPYEYYRKVEDFGEKIEAHKMLLEVNKQFEKSEFGEARDNALEYKSFLDQLNSRVKNVERTNKIAKASLQLGFYACTSGSVIAAIAAVNNGSLSFLFPAVCAFLEKYNEEKLSEVLTGFLSNVWYKNPLPYLVWRYKK
jgi:hypothetical protein